MERAISVAIGLAATYMFLAIVVAALVEAISGALDLRARTLQKALVNMLSQPLAQLVLDHPLLKAVNAAEGKRRWIFFQRMPAYIPRWIFADALIAEIEKLKKEHGPEEAERQYERLMEYVKDPRDKEEIRKHVDGLVRTVQTEGEEARRRAEDWFDAGMERVSGAYKRNTQRIARGAACALVVALNANAVIMTQTLWNDPAARDAAVAFAAAAREACAGPGPAPATGQAPVAMVRPSDCVNAVESLRVSTNQSFELPLGWSETRLDEAREGVWLWLVGFLLSIAAVGLGAPFWFDLLRRIAPGIQQSGPKPKA